MPRFRVKLTEVFYTEADSEEEAYAMWENEADYCEVEPIDEEDD